MTYNPEKRNVVFESKMFEYFNYNVLPNQQYQVMIGLINKNQIVELELLKVGELEL